MPYPSTVIGYFSEFLSPSAELGIDSLYPASKHHFSENVRARFHVVHGDIMEWEAAEATPVLLFIVQASMFIVHGGSW
jgi:hypothetical protein